MGSTEVAIRGPGRGFLSPMCLPVSPPGRGYFKLPPTSLPARTSATRSPLDNASSIDWISPWELRKSPVTHAPTSRFDMGTTPASWYGRTLDQCRSSGTWPHACSVSLVARPTTAGTFWTQSKIGSTLAKRSIPSTFVVLPRGSPPGPRRRPDAPPVGRPPDDETAEP